MADPKKIAILYASAGHGHAKAAFAVASAAKEAGQDPIVRDTLTMTRWDYGVRYRAFYMGMIRFFPWLWGICYALTDLPWLYLFVRPVRRWANGLYLPELEKWLIREKPDVVISTHFLGSEVTASLKRRGLLQSRLVTVITDYQTHHFWQERETDLYCVATAQTRSQLVARGVDPGKVEVTGIPIELKFSSEIDREAIRSGMGIKPKTFTVLVAGGGGGVGLVGPLVKELLKMEPAGEIIALCGTNKPLFERLSREAKERKNIHPYGFVENVHELMAACDMVAGKGGGLMITESLCMGKPMILLGAVPGQETRNVQTMTALGAAKMARSPERALQQIQVFRRNSELYRAASRAIQEIRRPLAARSVWELACGL